MRHAYEARLLAPEDRAYLAGIDQVVRRDLQVRGAGCTAHVFARRQKPGQPRQRRWQRALARIVVLVRSAIGSSGLAGSRVEP